MSNPNVVADAQQRVIQDGDSAGDHQDQKGTAQIRIRRPNSQGGPDAPNDSFDVSLSQNQTSVSAPTTPTRAQRRQRQSGGSEPRRNRNLSVDDADWTTEEPSTDSHLRQVGAENERDGSVSGENARKRSASDSDATGSTMIRYSTCSDDEDVTYSTHAASSGADGRHKYEREKAGNLINSLGHVPAKKSFKEKITSRLATGALFGSLGYSTCALIAVGVAFCVFAPHVAVAAGTAIAVLKIAGAVGVSGFLAGFLFPLNDFHGGDPVGKPLARSCNLLRHLGKRYSKAQCDGMAKIPDLSYRYLLFLEHPRGSDFAGERLAMQAAIIHAGAVAEGSLPKMLETRDELLELAKDLSNENRPDWSRLHKLTAETLKVNYGTLMLNSRNLCDGNRSGLDQSDTEGSVWDRIVENEKALLMHGSKQENREQSLQIDNKPDNRKASVDQYSQSSLESLPDDCTETDTPDPLETPSTTSSVSGDSDAGELTLALVNENELVHREELADPIGEYKAWLAENAKRRGGQKRRLRANEEEAFRKIDILWLRNLLDVDFDDAGKRKNFRMNTMETIYWNLEDEQQRVRSSNEFSLAYIEAYQAKNDLYIPASMKPKKSRESEKAKQVPGALPELYPTKRCQQAALYGRHMALEFFKTVGADNDDDQVVERIKDVFDPGEPDKELVQRSLQMSNSRNRRKQHEFTGLGKPEANAQLKQQQALEEANEPEGSDTEDNSSGSA